MICSKCHKPEAVIIVVEDDNFLYLCAECYSDSQITADQKERYYSA